MDIVKLKHVVQATINPWLSTYGLCIILTSIVNGDIHLQIEGKEDGLSVETIREHVVWVLETRFPCAFKNIIIYR